MKTALSLGLFSVLSVSSFAEAKVIYGQDNRVEVREANELQQRVASSAATMISINEITFDSPKAGVAQLTQRTLRDWLESQFSDESEEEKRNKLFSPAVKSMAKNGMTFCEGEKFVDQPNPGMCSGFLIAPDLIVTAGHCAELPTFCSEYRWVFGFEVDLDTNQAGQEIKTKDIYSCKRIISSSLSLPLGLDYAVVQLDRKVEGRLPLEIKNDKFVDLSSPLFVVGSPSGLPLKVASGAKVRSNSHLFYFSANLDTFQGNSGSGVFNAETGVVEGILVRGEEDFVPNQLKKCVEANRCEDEKCRGEDVTRMTAIPEVGVQKALYQAATNEDLNVIESILKLNVWIDFYTKDGQSAFMKAVIAGKHRSADLLLSRGAELNLQDAQGNSVAHYLALKNEARSLFMLEAFLRKGLKLELKNRRGETALLSSAKALNLPRVKALIKFGSLKDSTDLNNETVLFPFMRSGNKKAVKELIALGVNPGLKNLQGKTVFELK